MYAVLVVQHGQPEYRTAAKPVTDSRSCLGIQLVGICVSDRQLCQGKTSCVRAVCCQCMHCSVRGSISYDCPPVQC